MNFSTPHQSTEQMEAIADVRLTKRKLRSLVTDSAKSAAAVNLVYVSDAEPGISRRGNAPQFSYMLEGKKVTDKTILQRIKNLVLPPAWQKVWICTKENGHLQATGIDAAGRKQYKYHTSWTQLRNHTKFYHLYELGKALPAIREQLEKDLARKGLPMEKILALIVSVMQETGIRIGNNEYEKRYGTFGLSTLKNRHVQLEGSNIRLSFKGKKGVEQDLTFKNRKLARLIRQCKEIPGKELFQYYGEDGVRHTIDSGMVNNYIKEISGGHFTAKDFRTWTGTVRALLAFRDSGCAETATETKQKIIAVLDAVAVHLGNTRAVCRKYYVHPALIDLYECRAIEKYLRELEAMQEDKNTADLQPEERVLMKILEKA